MERHIFPKNGKYLSKLHDQKCIIIANKSHEDIDAYVNFCKLQFLESQWTTLIVDPSPQNVKDPDVFVVFCTDLNWDARMLQLYDIFYKEEKFINICYFGEEWCNHQPIGESLLISSFNHFILSD